MKNELKPKQWFMDRVGKKVFRDIFIGDVEVITRSDFKTIFIKGEFQAQYMFDIQNDLYYETGILMNYRDHEEN